VKRENLLRAALSSNGGEPMKWKMSPSRTTWRYGDEMIFPS